MLTTFLLHGGKIKLKNESNDEYFRELTKGLVDGDKVLFIGFARSDENERNEAYERDKQRLLEHAHSKILVVSATHENLIDQARVARAIHITNGDSPELVRQIQRHPDFVDAIRGKLVGGSSAGACLFSTYYFDEDELGVLEGLGTLPIRLRVHGNNLEFGDIKESIALLNRYPENLELVVINECAWIKRVVDL